MLPCPPSVPSSFPCPMAGTAPTAPVGSPVRVCLGVLVTLGALGEASVRVSTVTDSVERVRGLGIPAQVLQAIVTRISVVVTALHSLGARPDEGLQDELVNPSLSDHLPVVIKRDAEVSMSHRGRLLLPTLPDVGSSALQLRTNTVNAPNRSSVRDFVTRHPNHGSPLF